MIFGRTSGVPGPWQAKVGRNLAGVQQLTGISRAVIQPATFFCSVHDNVSSGAALSGRCFS
jgi:hypothetical protein